jgi:hypothetical protein
VPDNRWINEENVVYIHNALLFIHKEKLNHVICREMNETGEHRVKGNKPDSKRQVLHAFSNMWNIGGEKMVWM